MEMKASPVLVTLLCVSVNVHVALAQLQLRLRPSPSDHLPVPDLHEDPDPALEPGERDLATRLLRRKLGSSFDPVFSSIGPPTPCNGSEITDAGAGAIPREFQQLDFTGLKAAAKTERRVRRWLWSYTRCPVLSVWKDLGVRFWPRYVKEGQCSTERSCSLPEGMFCKPVQSVSVTLLRWHCQQGSRAPKRCAWIRAHYPVISQCGCASGLPIFTRTSSFSFSCFRMNTTSEAITKGFGNVSHSNLDARPIINHSQKTASRPDWLLYSVPASAFLIGIVLFTYVCKTQRRRNAPTKQRTSTNGHFATYTDFGFTGTSTQGYMESAENNKKDDTQSYENVEAAIYSNQDKVTYYVSADEDYLNPDAFVEEEVAGPDHNTLQLPSNLTDTDGESYENMEGCLYAQPRRLTKQQATEDEDYINPDEDRKQDLALDQTDTESYEMMAGPDCVYNNNDFTAANDTTEDDSYEQMNGIPVPFQKEMDGGRVGE